MTVSQFARRRAVSRQFIQRVANSLIERKLVIAMGDAKDRRAPKLTLTHSGSAAANAIRKRELPYQRLLHEALSNSEIDEVIERLERFDAKLEEVIR